MTKEAAKQPKAPNRNIPTILVVDDDRTMLLVLKQRLKKHGCRVIIAINGKSACAAIEKYHKVIDVVLLDRMMPDMDGLEVVKWHKAHNELTQMPIVMQTGSNKPEQIREGIDAGVFYYLTKPIQEDVLKSVVVSAVKESRQKRLLRTEMKKHKTGFTLIDACRFTLKHLDQAEYLACFIANSFPNPDVVMPGIAELLINSVEHGICGISYLEKSEMISKGIWRKEVIKRSNDEANANKVIDVTYTKQDNRFSMKIIDPGDGFAWHKYLNVDPARAMDNHGRGIARANMIFDALQYNKSGNEVVAIIDPKSHKELDW